MQDTVSVISYVAGNVIGKYVAWDFVRGMLMCCLPPWALVRIAPSLLLCCSCCCSCAVVPVGRLLRAAILLLNVLASLAC